MGILPSVEMVRSQALSASQVHFGVSDEVLPFSEGKQEWKLSEKKKLGSWVSYDTWRKLLSLVVFKRQTLKETHSIDLKSVSAQPGSSCGLPTARLAPAQHRDRGATSARAGGGQRVSWTKGSAIVCNPQRGTYSVATEVKRKPRAGK